MKVDIFIPCFIDQLYPETGMNMVRVLESKGCKVHYNPKQTCCGQPAFNRGTWADAIEVGEKFIEDFTSDRKIVTPSGSCAGYIRNHYEQLFGNSSQRTRYKSIKRRLFEFTEFLTDVLKVEDLESELRGVATYHDGCGSLRECQVKEAPRKLLKMVKGLELVEMNESETCCGFGGLFSTKFEPISIGMGEQKIENALNTKADYLVSADMSCLMHLNGYIQKHHSNIKVMHIADVLASGLK